MLIVPRRRGLFYPTYVQDYLDRVTAADVAAGNTQGLELGVTDAFSTTLQDLVSDGLLGISGSVIAQEASIIKAAAIMAGARTMAGALVPLVGPAPTNFNFLPPDYNRKTGLLGNGSTKRLDSNRAGNADPQNSKHLAMFIGETGIKTSFSNTMGDGENGNEVVSQLAITPDASQIATRLNTFTGIASNLYSGVGFYGVSRNNSATYLVRGSATSNTVTMASQTPNTANTGVFMRGKNPGAGPTQFFDGRVSFYSIGEAIDLAQLDTRVSALMTAIDGAIP